MRANAAVELVRSADGRHRDAEVHPVITIPADRRREIELCILQYSPHIERIRDARRLYEWRAQEHDGGYPRYIFTFHVCCRYLNILEPNRRANSAAHFITNHIHDG